MSFQLDALTIEQLLLGSGMTHQMVTVAAPMFRVKSLAKGDRFVSIGDDERWLGILASGTVLYCGDKAGEQVCTYAVQKGGIVLSLNAFFKGEPSREDILAIQPSKVYLLSHDAYTQLKERDSAFSNWALSLLEHEIVCINDRKLNFMCLTAEERYELMVQEDSDLLQLIPLKHLATMLGVTPRHLTRIRSNYRI